MINQEFWRGRSVFLTGHTGFKGGWLCLLLKSLGSRVSGLGLPPNTSPNLFEAADVGQAMDSYIGDIRDEQRLRETMRAAAPEVVVHLAAQPLVRYSYQNPVETYDVNVLGTLRLLDAVRAVGSVRAVVIVTSDKCYENQEWMWGYRENEPMGGKDPYSNSKGCAELVVHAYRHSFFNPQRYSEHRVAVASVRAGNVIGGGDWAQDRLVPDVIRCCASRRTVEIRNPTAVRPWLYVLDPLEGYLMLAEKLVQAGPEWGEAWNFGPNEQDCLPVAELVEALRGAWGQSAQWKVVQPDQLHEAEMLKLDSTKARTRLKWRPHWTVQQAVEATCAWYRTFYGQPKAVADITARTLRDHLALS